MLSQQQTAQRAPSHPCSPPGTPAGLSPTTSLSCGVVLSLMLPAVLRRSRPRSLPEPAAGYTNPAYFIFEGIPNTWLPHPGAGDAHDKRAGSPARDQQHLSPLGAWVPSSPEEQGRGQPHCVPGHSSRGHLLSPPSVGQQKRPKSAILERDTAGLGDCSLTALHMATYLSQLDQLSPDRGGDSQKTLLCQTRSALELPPRPCREVPKRPLDARQRGHPGEVPQWPLVELSQRGLGSSERARDMLLAIRPPADVKFHPHGSAQPDGAPSAWTVGYSGRLRSSKVPCS